MKKAELRVYENKAVFSSAEKNRNLVVSLEKDPHSTSNQKVFQLQEKIQLSSSHDAAVGSYRTIMLEHIFGFYELLSGPYVALITETEPFVDEKAIGSIRKVKRVKIVPLFKNTKLLSEPKQMDENRYLQLLNQTFHDNIFFLSTTCDVTLTQQRLALASFGKSDPIWIRADNRFFWNRDIVNDLINCKADDWITPFMSGFIDIRPDITIENNKFSLLLISRRSRLQQGCRYTKRGLDADGNPANFVETEQILIFQQPQPQKSTDGSSSVPQTPQANSNNNVSAQGNSQHLDLPMVSSFVQIRGSIILKWSSPVTMKYDPKVYIDDDGAHQKDIALKHIRDVHDTYVDNNKKSRVIFVNLIDTKNDQKRLGEAFEKIVKEVKAAINQKGDDILKYVWFDFHKETKQKGKWDNLAKLVNLLDADLKAQGFFCKTFGGKIVNYQIGVFRTNCMDNLDRTNVVQSLLARRSILYQLDKASLIAEKDDKLVLNTPWKSFETIYKTMWTHNADSLSLSYAGTGALKTDFTRTGKRTYKGILNDGLNAAMRYYVNNFTDGAKQDGIDLLLGKYRPIPLSTTPSPFAERMDRETLSNFLVRVFVFLVSVFSIFLLIYRLVSPISIIIGKTEFATRFVYFFHSFMNDSIGSNIFIKNVVILYWDVVSHFWYSSNSQKLCVLLTCAFGTTLLFASYLSYVIMKVGSRLGEKVVCRPQLLPDPLPKNFIE